MVGVRAVNLIVRVANRLSLVIIVSTLTGTCSRHVA